MFLNRLERLLPTTLLAVPCSRLLLSCPHLRLHLSKCSQTASKTFSWSSIWPTLHDLTSCWLSECAIKTPLLSKLKLSNLMLKKYVFGNAYRSPPVCCCATSSQKACALERWLSLGLRNYFGVYSMGIQFAICHCVVEPRKSL
jgi:hypothetical protein